MSNIQRYTELRPESHLTGRAEDADNDRWRVTPALLGEPHPEGVRCLACAHRCVIRPGRAGICGVRENRDGRLVSLVYGAVAAQAVEPIEKKPFFHVRPGNLAISVATPGCNLHCRFCQNASIAQVGRSGIAPLVRRRTPSDVVAGGVRAGAAAVAYTYVEPTVFVEFALDTAAAAHAAGLLNLFVTNGYQTPETVRSMTGLIDAANVDLKGFSDRFYRRVCGARLAPVLDALVNLRAAGIWVEVTTLLVPGGTDDPDDLRRLAAWLVAELGPETPWHVSRFFPAHRVTHVPPTPLATIRLAVAIGRDAGLRHVYPGNAPELGDAVTSCANCGCELIRRRGHSVSANALVAARCPRCSYPLAGIALGGSEDGTPGEASSQASRSSRSVAVGGWTASTSSSAACWAAWRSGATPLASRCP